MLSSSVLSSRAAIFHLDEKIALILFFSLQDLVALNFIYSFVSNFLKSFLYGSGCRTVVVPVPHNLEVVVAGLNPASCWAFTLVYPVNMTVLKLVPHLIIA